MKRVCVVCLMVALLLAAASLAGATELVYTPVNPSFGGNPLNGNFLLNKAQSQDNNDDPALRDALNNSDLDDFTDSLQRRVLSVVAQRISNALLGEEGLPEGTLTVGNFELDITDNLDSFTVVVRDTSTGKETTIELPVF